MTTAVEPQTITGDLLARLRAQPGCAAATFTEPPTEITGGYDTQIFSFRLVGAAAPWDAPLILRLFRANHDEQPRAETAIQNAVADSGYPCPRSLLAGGSNRISERPYMVMERAAGRPLLSYITSPSRMTLRATPTLAEAHARLHALDASLFRERLIANGLTSSDIEGMTFDAEFALVEEAAERLGIAALAPALEWLRAYRTAAVQQVVCHGDFHPFNVMMDGDGSYSLIDWTLAKIAEPEYDVARMVVLWRRAPIDRTMLSGPLRLLLGVGRRSILWRYMRLYRALRPLDADRLRYYEAFAATRLIITTLDGTNTTLWRSDGVIEGLTNHVRSATGIKIEPLTVSFVSS